MRYNPLQAFVTRRVCCNPAPCPRCHTEHNLAVLCGMLLSAGCAGAHNPHPESVVEQLPLKCIKPATTNQACGALRPLALLCWRLLGALLVLLPVAAAFLLPPGCTEAALPADAVPAGLAGCAFAAHHLTALCTSRGGQPELSCCKCWTLSCTQPWKSGKSSIHFASLER